MRGRLVGLYAVLAVGNILAWAWALIAFHDYPVLLGTGFLAYSFGLRHAVDADHIAAIDNVTRKLMQEGKRPLAAGFFFSLGHSTVVALATLAVALAATALTQNFSGFRAIGGVIGTLVSAGFLFAIALANLFVLAAVYRAFRRLCRGDPAGEPVELTVAPGFLGRLLRPLFGLIGKSWHMYPLGFLFGLGFDTASEIALLGIAAAEAAKGLPLVSVLVFPALFTAGMALVDTSDSVLMVGAYGWAFVNPVRKLYYNLTITFTSVVVAVAVGGIEALGLLADRLQLDGPFWRLIGLLNESFGGLGYLIIALFAVSWLVSALVFRLKGYDRAGTVEG
jgi:high-affinity nickel-transport protein